MWVISGTIGFNFIVRIKFNKKRCNNIISNNYEKWVFLK